MGYSYEQLKEWNPSIIYASNGGFGQKGEWAPRGSFDAVCQGFSGWMVSQGGGPDHPPCLAPFGLGDQVGALYFAYAIMGALVAKERYGMGQQIECSQLGAMTMLQGLGITATLHSGRENNSGNHGHETPNAHFTWYKCSDGKYLTTCALAANQWHSLCDAIDRPDLKESWSAIMGTMYAGSEMHEKLQEEVFGTNTRDYWYVCCYLCLPLRLSSLALCVWLP
jgi:crotonobetainyl-CoA:carnitine CoA-transferase CaiB-like acyl-CoA transferase